jgi:hypothetical protein
MTTELEERFSDASEDVKTCARLLSALAGGLIAQYDVHTVARAVALIDDDEWWILAGVMTTQVAPVRDDVIDAYRRSKDGGT